MSYYGINDWVLLNTPETYIDGTVLHVGKIIAIIRDNIVFVETYSKYKGRMAYSVVQLPMNSIKKIESN